MKHSKAANAHCSIRCNPVSPRASCSASRSRVRRCIRERRAFADSFPPPWLWTPCLAAAGAWLEEVIKWGENGCRGRSGARSLRRKWRRGRSAQALVRASDAMAAWGDSATGACNPAMARPEKNGVFDSFAPRRRPGGARSRPGGRARPPAPHVWPSDRRRAQDRTWAPRPSRPRPRRIAFAWWCAWRPARTAPSCRYASAAPRRARHSSSSRPPLLLFPLPAPAPARVRLRGARSGGASCV